MTGPRKMEGCVRIEFKLELAALGPTAKIGHTYRLHLTMTRLLSAIAIHHWLWPRGGLRGWARLRGARNRSRFGGLRPSRYKQRPLLGRQLLQPLLRKLWIFNPLPRGADWAAFAIKISRLPIRSPSTTPRATDAGSRPKRLGFILWSLLGQSELQSGLSPGGKVTRFEAKTDARHL
jgi:hypothetical protein